MVKRLPISQLKSADFVPLNSGSRSSSSAVEENGIFAGVAIALACSCALYFWFRCVTAGAFLPGAFLVLVWTLLLTPFFALVLAWALLLAPFLGLACAFATCLVAVGAVAVCAWACDKPVAKRALIRVRAKVRAVRYFFILRRSVVQCCRVVVSGA